MDSRRKLRQYCKNAAEVRAGLRLHARDAAGAEQGAVARPARAGARRAACSAQRNETAVLFTLSTEVPARRPRRHPPDGAATTTGRSSTAKGCPTCPTARRSYYQGVQEFNAQSRNVKVVFINQFGFDAAALRQAHAGRHGVHGHPQGLGRRVRPEHLRAVRHRPGGADQLRRDLRLQQRLRLRRLRRTRPTGGSRRPT